MESNLLREQAVRGGEDVPWRDGDAAAERVIVVQGQAALAVDLVHQGLPRNLKTVILSKQA